MPQPLATNVTAAARDLIGSAAPLAPDNSSAAAFDSLLQRAQLAAALKPQRLAVADDLPVVANDGANKQDLVPVVESTTPSAPPIDPNEDLPELQEHSAEPVVAESLAALALLPPMLIADLPAQSETDVELANGQPVAQRVKRLSDGESIVTATTVEHVSQVRVAAETPIAQETHFATADTTRTAAASESGKSERPSVDSISLPETISTAHVDDDADSAGNPVAATSTMPAQTQHSAEHSTVQIVVNPTAAADLTVQRSPLRQLPAEATDAERRPPVAIDMGRLLTRVARAFAAAQQRDGEIHMRLSPPELGSLRLDVRVNGGELWASLQAETEAARAAILENLPALSERLAHQGLRIERFEVDLMQRQSGGMPDQTGGRQSEAPAVPPRFMPATRDRRPATTSSNPRTAGPGPANGLNVII
jgi:flagellar hook-length control protein FliK